MATLRIRLFGTLRLTRDGSGQEVRPTRGVQGLLAYLVLHRHRLHSRPSLAGTFWADLPEHRARSCLSTSLWRVRRLLETEGKGSYLITSPAGEVGFDRNSDHWLDVEVLERAARQAAARPFHSLEPADADRLEEALGLYTGDALDGFYEDWALRERERLRALYLEGLGTLMRFYGYHGRYDDALAAGRRLLATDPLREEVRREMMRLYLESGQRSLAVQQYRACRDSLSSCLGIEPMAETDALYLRAVDRSGAGPASPPAAALDAVVRQLHGALRACDDARTQLDQALRAVASLVAPEDGD